MTSYQQLGFRRGFGVISFESPKPVAPISAPAEIPITNNRTILVGGIRFLYATIDNVDPRSTNATCSNELFVVPRGWMIADNTNITRGRISAIISL